MVSVPPFSEEYIEFLLVPIRTPGPFLESEFVALFRTTAKMCHLRSSVEKYVKSDTKHHFNAKQAWGGFGNSLPRSSF